MSGGYAPPARDRFRTGFLLDSALASAARLVVDELRLAPRSLLGGRIAMVAFMALGAALTLWGNQSLFDAVAVSGTASMFLTPVLLVGLVMGCPVAVFAGTRRRI